MIDQIIIGDKASFDDFGASVAARAYKPPQKKSVKETVPFSNITHDFTAINGEIYWEESELEYVFEMIAPTPERLEAMKTAFSTWVMNVIEQELHDPIIPDYHYIATYDDMSWEDDEGLEKTTVSVVFTAYPYKIANFAREYTFVIEPNSWNTVWLENNSSHRITPTVTCDGTIHIRYDDMPHGEAFTFNSGTTINEDFKLNVGAVEIRPINYNSEAVKLTIQFREEVF